MSRNATPSLPAEPPPGAPADNAGSDGAARQRVRLLRHGIGALSSLVVIGISYLYAVFDFMPMRVAHVFGGITLLTVLVFTTCIAAGLNQRFADPSMTMAQVMSAGVSLAYLAYAAASARATMLPWYLTALLFGAFRLSLRRLMVIAAYFTATYGAAVVASKVWPPVVEGPMRMPTDDFLFMELAIVLMWLAWVGGNISLMRKRLHASNADLSQALKKIEVIASFDELTGLYNRRTVNELIAKEKKRSDRNGLNLSIAMVDADNFKRINDVYGHAAGDEVLRMLSRSLQSGLREPDSVGRYGGEEFIIVLPDTGADSATIPLERLRQRISATAIATLPPDFRVTVSIGIGHYRRGEDILETVKRADAALYQAKHAGRNRIVSENSMEPAESVAG